MNDLQVKTIKFEPAKVEFNYDELAAILDTNLRRYAGLTFTEKQAADCKKTIAELRKGKKAVDAYRKETKKKLTASVTEFEDQCKTLNKKFDEVLTPLISQYDQFEDDRKDRKRKQIQVVIDDLLEKEGLNEKYAEQLVVEDGHLAKSKTIKAITEELTTKAEHLGIQQDKDEANAEIIKGHIALVNEKYDLQLTPPVYLRLLNYQSIEEVKAQINADAEQEVQKAQSPEPVSNEQFKQVPLGSAPGHDGMFVEKYEVTGTESQLDALEEFMKQEEIKWKVIE